nr:glycoside hydrolase family 3 N-terminal domain-containing protein [uncultured Bacteroides sp.]
MYRKKFFLGGLMLLISLSVSSSKHILPYKDPHLSVEERTKDLLNRMTLEEKVGQLLCPLGWEMYQIDGHTVRVSEKFKSFLKQKQMGMLWGTYRADPWTKKTLENGLNPEYAAQAGNALQKYIIENTRLGIPIFLAEEAPHGHMAIGTTVFPTGIAMAATWSPHLLQREGEVIAKEIRLQGGHISYGPVLDLARDPRWSRVEETFGEDPVLSASLGAAMVKGLGGGNLNQPYATIATLKHFIAYGVPEGGQNGNPSTVGQRELLTDFLPPFRQAIKAGALSVMTSYNSMDGIPSTANTYLLTEILRKQWDFKGFSISDLYSIEGLQVSHFVAASSQEAALMSLKAGLDADLGGDAFATLVQSVREKKIDEALVDTAVCRLLRLKFSMGLFEHPYVNPQTAKKEVRCQEHICLARECAQKSIVLLKNHHHTLPLSKEIKTVAVVGPNADNVYNMLGDYTAPQEAENVVTVLEGVKNKIGADRVVYAKGCAIRDTTHYELQQALEAARNADVIVAVVGGSSARDFKTSYKETGAAITNSSVVSDMECGEGFDRASLQLMGKQQALLQALKSTGKPLVVIYIEGRSLNKNWTDKHADALLTAWYPGQEGGTAIADILFGDYNPAGRLPVSVPRSVGQIPVYYNKRNPATHDYVEMSSTPLYPFGFGMSYSTFEYSDLKITQKAATCFEVSFKVKNTGKYDGDEVAQLYLRDELASVVQPVKQLKHFQRVFIKKGEEKEISFQLTEEDFSLVDAAMKRVVEPGTFQLQIGSSSDDIRLTDKVEINE